GQPRDAATAFVGAGAGRPGPEEIVGVHDGDRGVFAENRYDETYIANYSNVYVLDALKRIPGANQTAIFGTPDYAMRIWLKPDRMASLGVTATDVQQAVANQNQQFAVGS